MKEQHATIHVLSPLFLGGWQEERKPVTHVGAEARAPSLRGVLRYWYRAIRNRGTEKGPSDAEQRLFGSTAGEKGQASAFRVRLIRAGKEPLTWRGPPDSARSPTRQRGRGNPLQYLLYPLTMRVERQYWKPRESRFLLRLLWRRPNPDETLVRELRDACFAAFHLGGLGTRSRRGAGAVTADFGGEWEDWFRAPSGGPAQYRDWLQKRLQKIVATRAVDREPEAAVLHPAWSSVHVVNRTFRDWEEALCFLGDKMSAYRKGRSDLERAAFGLPVKVGRTTVRPEKKKRRASPLLFTLNRLEDGRLLLTVTWFRGRFLPQGEGIITRRGVQMKPPPSEILADFLKEIQAERCYGEVE